MVHRGIASPASTSLKAPMVPPRDVVTGVSAGARMGSAQLRMRRLCRSAVPETNVASANAGIVLLVTASWLARGGSRRIPYLLRSLLR